MSRWKALAAVTVLYASPCAVLEATGRADPLSGEVLPFIEDDYPRALAQARARQVPLFVESWAPW
jgi:hypothetical protein